MLPRHIMAVSLSALELLLVPSLATGTAMSLRPSSVSEAPAPIQPLPPDLNDPSWTIPGSIEEISFAVAPAPELPPLFDRNERSVVSLSAAQEIHDESSGIPAKLFLILICIGGLIRYLQSGALYSVIADALDPRNSYD